VIAVTPKPYQRVIASDLLVRDTADLLDMTGSAGILARHEEGAAAAGYLEWAHRFAQGTSIYGGTTDIQRNLIAEQFLGLPRHRGAVRP
jgi:alkylation response protein AidB-like acyl-CoA dehydrogenase